MEEKVLAQYRVSDDPNAKKSDWIFYVFLILSLLIPFLGFIAPEDIGIVPIFLGAVSTIIISLLCFCGREKKSLSLFGKNSLHEKNDAILQAKANFFPAILILGFGSAGTAAGKRTAAALLTVSIISKTGQNACTNVQSAPILLGIAMGALFRSAAA